MTQRLTVLAAASIIVLGLVGTFLIVLDEQRLKGLVSEWGSSAAGGQLIVRGGLRWRWERGVLIEFDDVQVDGWEVAELESQILAESMRVRVRLLPLLRGRLAVSELEWQDARVRLSTASAVSPGPGGAVGDLSVADPGDSAARGPSVLPERLVFNRLAVDFPQSGRGSRAGFVVDEVIISDVRPGLPIPFLVDGVVLEPETLGPLRVQGQLANRGNGAWTLADIVAVGLTADGRYRFSLSGDAGLDVTTGRLELDQNHFELNGFDFTLSGVYDFQDGQAFVGRLQAGLLDVDSLALANHLAALAHGPALSDSVFDQASLDLAIEIAQIARSGLVLEPFSARLGIADGHLSVREVQAGLPGAWLDGELHWQPRRQAPWHGQIDLTIASFDELMASAGHSLSLSGAGSLLLDVSSRPVPARGIEASWLGSGFLELLDGRWSALESLPPSSEGFDSLLAQVELQPRAVGFSDLELAGSFGRLSGLLLLPFDGRPAAGALSLASDDAGDTSLVIEGPPLRPRLVAAPDLMQQ